MPDIALPGFLVLGVKPGSDEEIKP